MRLNVQAWVAPHLKEAYGEAWGRELAALDTPPPVDLRVNRLKATPDEARAALAREGVETEPMALAPDGLRLKRR
ncbi:MAG: rRNA cytosine-C5-methylase, partial [Alphaproteobacteria bacterium]|nr:rRNA cytosine-C5-methylase [Alphaproteobacteria bacterium]